MSDPAKKLQATKEEVTEKPMNKITFSALTAFALILAAPLLGGRGFTHNDKGIPVNVSEPSPTVHLESVFKSTQEPVAEAKSGTDVKIFIASGDFGLLKDPDPTDAEGRPSPFQFALGPLGELKSGENVKVFTPYGGVTLPKEPLFVLPDPSIEGPQCIFRQGIAGEPKVKEIILKTISDCENSPSNIKR